MQLSGAKPMTRGTALKHAIALVWLMHDEARRSHTTRQWRTIHMGAPPPDTEPAAAMRNLFDSAARTLPSRDFINFVRDVISDHNGIETHTFTRPQGDVEAGVTYCAVAKHMLNLDERHARNIRVTRDAMQVYARLLAETKYNPDSGESSDAP